MTFFAAMTTIQAPTTSVLALLAQLRQHSGTLIVAGDRKGPCAFQQKGVVFLSLKDQLHGSLQIAAQLPVDHYARKNVAYLEAICRGADCIFETDDDNAPLEHWRPRCEILKQVRLVPSPTNPQDQHRWVNAYRYFSDSKIWPRGFPLCELNTATPATEQPSASLSCRAPIQQSLCAGSPDVDALWRLTTKEDVVFSDATSVLLGPGNWCPFNTQSTWWWPIVYPLLYVPSHCSFRMCDIWKSFVAQACLWQLGYGVAYHSPDVIQERNPHDLMRDFADEVPGYLNNGRFPGVLAEAGLRPGPGAVCDNLMAAYTTLVSAGLFPPEELALVEAWLGDLQTCGWKPAT